MRLEQFDDWGSIYYAEKGKGKTNGFASSENGLPLSAGLLLEVTYPDGTKSVLPLAARNHRKHVMDMGNEYDVDSDVFGFKVDYHGVWVWIPIEEVDVVFVPKNGKKKGSK